MTWRRLSFSNKISQSELSHSAKQVCSIWFLQDEWFARLAMTDANDDDDPILNSITAVGIDRLLLKSIYKRKKVLRFALCPWNWRQFSVFPTICPAGVLLGCGGRYIYDKNIQWLILVWKTLHYTISDVLLMGLNHDPARNVGRGGRRDTEDVVYKLSPVPSGTIRNDLLEFDGENYLDLVVLLFFHRPRLPIPKSTKFNETWKAVPLFYRPVSWPMFDSPRKDKTNLHCQVH